MCFPFSWLSETPITQPHQTVWSLRHRSYSCPSPLVCEGVRGICRPIRKTVCHQSSSTQELRWMLLCFTGGVSLTAWDCPEASRGEEGLGTPKEEGLGRGLGCPVVSQHHGRPHKSELWMTAVLLLSMSSRCWHSFSKYAKNLSLVQAGFWAKDILSWCEEIRNLGANTQIPSPSHLYNTVPGTMHGKWKDQIDIWWKYEYLYHEIIVWASNHNPVLFNLWKINCFKFIASVLSEIYGQVRGKWLIYLYFI